jgi:acetolactate synthase-1/2/3 large subunit
MPERDATLTRVATLTVAELLIAYLGQLGIAYVFGVPGGAIEPLYDALAASDTRGGPRAIVARHETGAAFMADGYAQQTGHIGVCCATTGPGSTNLITGIASAYASCVPLLAITAQTALHGFGRNAFQESSCTGINILGMFEHCTHYNTLVSHVDQFEHKLVSALMTALGPRPGPVHLSIPIDVMRADTGLSQPSFNIRRLLEKSVLVDTSASARLNDIVLGARKIAFVVGEGAAPAIGGILWAAWLLDAPIIATPHGKGLINPFHPLYRGVIGFAGHASAYEALSDAALDVVICIGATLSEWASNGWDMNLLLNRRLVHVDELNHNLTASPMAQLHVRGNISAVIGALVSSLEQALPAVHVQHKQKSRPLVTTESHRRYAFALDDEAAFYDETIPLKPPCLMRYLPLIFPPSTRYFADVGAAFAWGIHYLHPGDRRLAGGARDTHGGLFRASLEFASMGWAIGTAVGASLAKPNQPVVCITGDGSWLMSGQELTVAVQEQLPIVFLILNDSSLGMVRHGQRMAGAADIATDIPFTDFAAMARSMGAIAHVITSAADLRALQGGAAISQTGPTVLDVRIDRESIPPIQMRINHLRGITNE